MREEKNNETETSACLLTVYERRLFSEPPWNYRSFPSALPAGLARFVDAFLFLVNPALYLSSSFFRSILGAVILGVGLHTAVYAGSDEGGLPARIARASAEKKIDLRLKAMAEVGAHVSVSEVKDALSLAETLKELRERAVLREAVIKRWGELAPADAWSYIMKLPESRGKLELVRTVTTTYATQAPAQAAAAVAETGSGRSKVEATAIVAEVWAKTNVPASLKWIQSLPAGPAREAALYNLRFIWVHSDPVAAAEDIVKMEPGDIRRMLIMNIAGEWAGRDPAKAIAWARGLAEEADQTEALFNIAESWADTRPREAGEFALQLSSPLRQRAAVAVAARWATQDPNGAAEWAVRSGDPVIQSRGLGEVFGVWASVDPSAAQQWVKTVDQVSVREIALHAYIDAVTEWAPATATELSLQLSDPAARLSGVESALARWREVDPASARVWLEAADLPAETKHEWLARAPVSH